MKGPTGEIGATGGDSAAGVDGLLGPAGVASKDSVTRAVEAVRDLPRFNDS